MLIAAAALLAFVSPAWALTQDEAQQRASSVGCTATVVTVESTGFNAYYNQYNHEVILVGFDTLPETWQKLILWHEIGHCLQSQAGEFGSLRAKGPYELEWDADRFAIRQLAEEGIDGADLNATIWATVYQQYDYKGDEYDSHGTTVDRITRGNLNRVFTRVES